MSGASKQRTRPERIDSLGIQKPRLGQWWKDSDKSDFAIRLLIGLIAAIALLVVCQTWKLPFSFRTGEIPERDIVTRIAFEVLDETETASKRQRVRREQLAFYSNRTAPLDDLRAAIKTQMFLILGAPSYEALQSNETERNAFVQFFADAADDGPQQDSSSRDSADEGTDADRSSTTGASAGDDSATGQANAPTPESLFTAIKKVFADDPQLSRLDEAIRLSMADNYRKGLILAPQHDAEEGSQERIRVYQVGQPDKVEFVEIKDVQIAQVDERIRKNLKEQFRTRFPGNESRTDEETQTVADLIVDSIVKRLPNYETLTYDPDRSEKARAEAAAAVEPVMLTYRAGRTIAEAGKPLEEQDIRLLRHEWQTMCNHMTWVDKSARVAAYAGMFAALYLLCGSFIFFVDDRRLLTDRVQLAKLLTVMVATVALAFVASRDQWRGELVPVVLASIIGAVVYGRELTLLLLAAASISLTLLLGTGLPELVAMAAAFTSCTLLLGRIRSRTHLLYVGTVSAAITVATVIGVGIVTSQTLSSTPVGTDLEILYRGPLFSTVVTALTKEGFWAGFCILVSATAMTGLLPLVEKAFGVQTDLSLLELGDASHPLLRRLAQRAPGTYNHSINVASIAEAAADEIGANGLLVRVGAYFHDIGKMFKPEYFIENQSAGINQHDSLQPAMSTLVIIAHVKDGADLARSHHLPEPIIDFILQHHGTTLVEYFYREATKRSEEDPNAESVSDKDFRYPGPKPQSLEAAVMMLADAVESASRTLVDPTPARIQGLVDSIAQKKMADGQFDECGLTFRQLDRIRRSLVKSLTAIYHARVKYPGQQSA